MRTIAAHADRRDRPNGVENIKKLALGDIWGELAHVKRR